MEAASTDGGKSHVKLPRWCPTYVVPFCPEEQVESSVFTAASEDECVEAVKVAPVVARRSGATSSNLNLESDINSDFGLVEKGVGN